MRDTRHKSREILSPPELRIPAALFKVLLCLALAPALTFGPDMLGLGWYDGLSEAGKWMLMILYLAAALWITEALPAFTVAILVIALEIAILGKPGGVFAEPGDTTAWQQFLAPWASSIMWLFLGGFVLAHAAVKTRLDSMCASKVLSLLQGKPALILAGVMGITFVFSMFMSNTATAAMMLAVTAPLARQLPPEDRFGAGLLLSVALAANIGGMGTLIGTPPNAIAAGAVERMTGTNINFLRWMMIGVPVAAALAVAAYFFLLRLYPCSQKALQPGPQEEQPPEQGSHFYWNRFVVMAVFAVTIALWMSVGFHGIPAPVVSFFAIAALAVSGVIIAEDMRKLPWDVLLLLAGGLSLGAGIEATGVAKWLPQLLPEGLSPLFLTLAICYLSLILSNVMSNTATAAMLLPIAISLATASEEFSVLAMAAPVALSCSAAMCLPISTPPNAIAFSSGRLQTRDFLRAGLLLGLVAPAFAYLWYAIYSRIF